MVLVDGQHVQFMAGCLVVSSYFGPDLVFRTILCVCVMTASDVVDAPSRR